MFSFTDLQEHWALQAENRRLNQLVADLEARNKHLEAMASIDTLTGLHSRRAFDERLVEEIDRARREIGIPLTLVLFDLDHFKEINDTHGHVAGDTVLRSIGETINEHGRVSDFAARVGGEEFALILSSTSIGNAGALVERLRSHIENLVVEVGGKTIKVTSSFGVVEWKEEMDPLHFFHGADLLLYKAKEHGRNRVECS